MVDPKLLRVQVIPNKSVWDVKHNTEVKITYIPTNYSVRCNATRSQHKNKQIALQYIEHYIKGLNYGF